MIGWLLRLYRATFPPQKSILAYGQLSKLKASDGYVRGVKAKLPANKAKLSLRPRETVTAFRKAGRS